MKMARYIKAIGVLFLWLSAGIMFTLYNPFYNRNYVINSVGISIPLNAKIQYYDDHIGLHQLLKFHRVVDDVHGYDFAKVIFSSKEILPTINKIKSDKNWHVLPLSKNIKNFISSYFLLSQATYSKSNGETDNSPDEIFDIQAMLQVKHGYWIFVNRTPIELRGSEDMTSRFGPLQYSYAVFDTDNDTLYFFVNDQFAD